MPLIALSKNRKSMTNAATGSLSSSKPAKPSGSSGMENAIMPHAKHCITAP